jgi:peroxiredoxin
MGNTDTRPPVGPGEPAPDFILPAGNREGTIALSDYRGKTPVLLAIMRGLYCAFCRRHVARLATTRRMLLSLGVEVLVVSAMPADRLRLYYRFRPVGVPVAADPDLATHRSYGVPQPPLTSEIEQAVAAKYLELARQLQIGTTDQAAIRAALGDADGFRPVAAELHERRDWSQRHGAQLIGQFLVDRDGIVRWSNIEGEAEGPAGLEKFPTDEEFLEAARRLAS